MIMVSVLRHKTLLYQLFFILILLTLNIFSLSLCTCRKTEGSFISWERTWSQDTSSDRVAWKSDHSATAMTWTPSQKSRGERRMQGVWLTSGRAEDWLTARWSCLISAIVHNWIQFKPDRSGSNQMAPDFLTTVDFFDADFVCKVAFELCVKIKS